MKKILSILFVSIFVLSGLGASALSKTDQPLIQTNSLDDDAPIWEVGDTWVYTINNISVYYNYSGQKIYVDGSMEDFTWKVTDTTGDYYTLAISGKLTATYDITLSYEAKTLHLVGSFSPTLTRFTGTLQLTKSDLQIHDFSLKILGITKVKINSLPFNLPIPFRIVSEAQLSADFPMMSFPIHEVMFWNLPDLTLTMSTTFGGLFGIVQIPFTTSIHYSWTPLAFFCLTREDVTVAAGSYNAYKIQSLIGSNLVYYYAPTAGNLVKFTAVLFNGAIQGELKSTNFS
jgi:hypothetical protein